MIQSATNNIYMYFFHFVIGDKNQTHIPLQYLLLGKTVIKVKSQNVHSYLLKCAKILGCLK